MADHATDNLPETISAEQLSGQAKARNVRAMFGAIARRYDLLNHLLSANLDRVWRRACVRAVSRRVAVTPPRILDIGCGTADLSLAFAGTGPVTGCDFCHAMLVRGAAKVARVRTRFPVKVLEADALALPFADGSFDVVVSAFVLRNLADMDRALAEMWRVLRPGGVLGVLDFGLPRFYPLRRLYQFYFLKVLPRLGQWISGATGPYQYLPRSVGAFPPVEELGRKAAVAGFQAVEYRRLAAGITVLLTGRKMER